MGHHWFRCGVSPVLPQAIIYEPTLMYSQLGPWEQIPVKSLRGRVNVGEIDVQLLTTDPLQI